MNGRDRRRDQSRDWGRGILSFGGGRLSTCAEMFGLKSPLPSATSASPGRKSTSIICMRWPSAIIVPPRSSVFRGPRITSAITPPPSLVAVRS